MFPLLIRANSRFRFRPNRTSTLLEKRCFHVRIRFYKSFLSSLYRTLIFSKRKTLFSKDISFSASSYLSAREVDALDDPLLSFAYRGPIFMASFSGRVDNVHPACVFWCPSEEQTLYFSFVSQHLPSFLS